MKRGSHANSTARFRFLVFAVAIAVCIAAVGTVACGCLASTTYKELPEIDPTITGPVEAAWVAYYAGPAKQIDELADMTVDGAGNIYVTGSAATKGSIRVEKMEDKTDVDYVTVKFGSDGTREWAKRYDGKGDSLDFARALALDSEGNVIVTGTSGTVKYNSDGKLLWASGKELAKGTDVAVDDSGNVYVTGEMGTLKCDSAGEGLWDVEGGGRAIRLDTAGHVYVGCKQDGLNVTKYGSDGDMLWSRVANVTDKLTGTPPPLAGMTTSAVGMDIDQSGNVYLTGWLARGASTSNLVTVKYDTGGTQQWIDYYPAGGVLPYKYSGDRSATARAVPVDASGYVYVVRNVSEGFTAAKYDREGTQVWACSSRGYWYLYTAACLWVIAVDDSGNVYVAGSDATGYHDYRNPMKDEYAKFYDTDFVIIKYAQ